MDTYRGIYGGRSDTDDHQSYDYSADSGTDTAPAAIGQDERRMQVRAYNHWAGMLGDRTFPAIEDLVPAELPDFGPNSVLLDFTGGIENPAIQFLGEKLGIECGAQGEHIRNLDDVPSRSLLSRITDHYMQIIANQAPIGFEAEFVNQRGKAIAYRGILLPFSSDNDTIDFILGVINWKELADQQATDELMLEIDQALEPVAEPVAQLKMPLTDWADGPASHDDEDGDDPAILDLSLDPHAMLADEDDGLAWPEPRFGADSAMPFANGDPFAAAAEALERAAAEALEPVDETEAADMGLADWLASAREMAQAARSSEDRTRGALYAAIGRAYDFSIAATEEPEEFRELIEDAGLAVQDRAPLTPVVKLVFGVDYDKTRLTEYAAALGHAQRIGLPRGALANYLIEAPGGLKGVVQAERRLRKEQAGKTVDPADTAREKLARKLRALPTLDFADLPADGAEFAVLIARRMDDGSVVLVGEVPDDVALLERAARRLIG
ncbi:hypothetical protein ACFO0A_02105 [Novosphingobium tardum]|uniref:PAS domain-containing protein n=1 Tax=Novosphingobium tardum TaxID=1538021 RepID=A0ABV8RMT0_9SPHN